jgi:hypothetical protein
MKSPVVSIRKTLNAWAISAPTIRKNRRKDMPNDQGQIVIRKAMKDDVGQIA